MYDDEQEDTRQYTVVVNHEEQYSIWFVGRELPLGWTEVGKVGLKQECLDYIEQVWTDMRPLSLRKQMDEDAHRAQHARVTSTPRELAVGCGRSRRMTRSTIGSGGAITERALIEGVRDNDVQKVRELLGRGAAADERDEYGWTALSWACGKGDSEAVSLLLAHGADAGVVGRDNRTPEMIAVAADHPEIVPLLRAVAPPRTEDAAPTVTYCRGYLAKELRAFEGFPEPRPNADDASGTPGADAPDLADDEVVFLHQDYSVTRSFRHGEDVLFDAVTPEWVAFSRTTLRFALPTDIR